MQRSYEIQELPPFLILHLKRFQKNDFFTEKNATIITFPIANLDLTPYFRPTATTENTVPTEADLRNNKLSLKQMRAFLTAQNKASLLTGALEKSDLVSHCVAVSNSLKSVKYNLVANICHESPGE